MREKQDELPVLSIRLRGRCYVLRRIANVGGRFASQLFLGGATLAMAGKVGRGTEPAPIFPAATGLRR
jgi:hypothetical protein